MARPNVEVRDMKARQVRAWEFKRDKNICDLSKERREKKKKSSSKRVPINPTIPSWKCGVNTTINSLMAVQNLDRMIAYNIVAEDKETKKKREPE